VPEQQGNEECIGKGNTATTVQKNVRDHWYVNKPKHSNGVWPLFNKRLLTYLGALVQCTKATITNR